MNVSFFDEMNELIIESILEASDEEILASIGGEGLPTWNEVQQSHDFIQNSLQTKREERLEANKSKLLSFKSAREKLINKLKSSKKVDEMVGDIVNVIQNKEGVPDGVLIAFREQSKGGSDDDIKDIWENLVRLGLIDIEEDE